MEREYWLSRWREKRTGFNLDSPHEALLQYLDELGLQPSARVFVPLCGKTIDMRWLAEQGCTVLGVEFSLQACEEFFAENQLKYRKEKQGAFEVFVGEKITLFCGDFFDLSKDLLGPLDAVYDRAALIALPASTRVKYAHKMASIMSEHTKILLVTMQYNQSEMEGPPFSVDEKEVRQLFGQRFYIVKKKEVRFDSVDDYLQQKGLSSAGELVFLLTPLVQK